MPRLPTFRRSPARRARPWRWLGLCAGLLPAWDAAAEPVSLKLWRHETGDAEMGASAAAIRRFNQSQDRWRIRHETLPQSSYTEAITAAALARQLPCILGVDQPTVPNFAWAGHLRALDRWLPDATRAQLTAGAQGKYRDALYSVGQFDVTLALFARRAELESLGVRVADMSSPYTADEFLAILRKLRRDDPERFPLDINTAWHGEWITYAYSPWLQSAGGDLIDRSDFATAEGTLNGPGSLAAVRWYRRLFDEGIVERRSVDDQAFLRREVVFQYTGSWAAKAYAAAFGDDLLIMPPMDFGRGPKVGAGSWQWGISRTCAHPSGAAAFLRFLLQAAEIAVISAATGLVPATEAAAALTEAYRLGGAWRLFFEFTRRYATPRPQTPGYPKIASSFEKAMLDVRNGKDPLHALDAAVDGIEYDILRNRGYGFGTERGR